MKLSLKIILALFTFLVASAVGGHFYFDKKFTPPKNHLVVKGNSNKVPITWLKTEVSPISALLLPVKIKEIPTQFYMQLDFGSPTTVFYSKPIASIQKKYPLQFDQVDSSATRSLDFHLSDMVVSSSRFKIINYGDPISWNGKDEFHIIGTIGTDLLEKRVLMLDFKDDHCDFTESIPNDTNLRQYVNFEFKKRRILLPAKIEEEEVTLLYDSGTSAFELITSKKVWDKYAEKDSKPTVNKGNSWGNTLTTYTASSNESIWFGKTKMDLSEVTYIEGTSLIQNTLMQLSGMQGMVGNKLFLGRTVVLDCRNQKYLIR